MLKFYLRYAILFICLLLVLTLGNTVSYADYNQEVKNAEVDLRGAEISVTQENTKVATAWTDVSILQNAWSNLSIELQDVPINQAIGAITELVTMDWGSLWLRLYHSPDVVAEYVKFKSIGDALDDAIAKLTVDISFFDISVDIYEYSWEILDMRISGHHGQIVHDGHYSVPHTVPRWQNWTCKRDLPTFSCRGADDCDKTFYTTYDAKYQDRRECGKESPPPGYQNPISGCDDVYYTCDEAEAEEHKVWFCAKWFWENNRRKERCGFPYRDCTNLKRNHRNAFWSWKTKHEHRAEEISDYFANVGTSDNDPDDPDGTLANTDNSPNCDVCTTGGCSACPSLSPLNGSSYFVSLGDLHEAGFRGNKPHRVIYWHVQPPGDTSPHGPQVNIDIGGSTSTEEDLIYRIPNNAATGTYTISAHVHPYDGGESYWVSYPITVR